MGRIFISLFVVAACRGQEQRRPPQVVRFTAQAVASPGPGNIPVIDSQHIWVGLSYTADGGSSWTGRFPPPGHTPYLFDPDIEQSSDQHTRFITADRGFLGGPTGVWATQDGGMTWSMAFDNYAAIQALAHSGEHVWMAVGDEHSARNYISDDLGKSWHPCGAEWKYSVAAPHISSFLLNSLKGWAVVAKYDSPGRHTKMGVARTQDGGCSWTILWWAPATDILGDIRFVDRNFGWMAASDLRETRDGGIHWRSIRLPRSDFSLEGAYPVDTNRGWVIGSPAPNLYETVDGGIHWRAVSDSDLRLDQGAARELPPSWGAGTLMKIQAGHDQRN
jgi:photosystem II stability/assembly factor-like uncharacterized protein